LNSAALSDFIAQRRWNEGVDETATQSGCAATAVGEFVSCSCISQLWRHVIFNLSGVYPCRRIPLAMTSVLSLKHFPARTAPTYSTSSSKACSPRPLTLTPVRLGAWAAILILQLTSPRPHNWPTISQSALREDQALDQPGAPGAQDGGHAPEPQPVRARCFLSAIVCPHGQAQCQYRCGPQARTQGVLHHDARRGLRGPGAAALRSAAASAQRGDTQTPGQRHGLCHQSSDNYGLKAEVRCFVS
jgi:hypothetical protein